MLVNLPLTSLIINKLRVLFSQKGEGFIFIYYTPSKDKKLPVLSLRSEREVLSPLNLACAELAKYSVDWTMLEPVLLNKFKSRKNLIVIQNKFFKNIFLEICVIE